MRITWSEVSVENLSAIHDFISLDSPGRADRFLPRLIAAAEPLEAFPQMGRLVPEGDGRQREILFEPYRLIYRVDEDEVFIVAVVHQARDLASLLES